METIKHVIDTLFSVKKKLGAAASGQDTSLRGFGNRVFEIHVECNPFGKTDILPKHDFSVDLNETRYDFTFFLYSSSVRG